MLARGPDARWVETDHEKRAVSYFAGKLNHAGPSGQQINRRR
jgi:hypothetical protein